ncbi:MAG: TonB-dependent receptor [Steroidobacteraceae bacterium]|jgi:outer membrane receptor protein involved in Fe transport|nr:TonB-dependent receptor [Steroidobacteraceae bacterium]
MRTPLIRGSALLIAATLTVPASLAQDATAQSAPQAAPAAEATEAAPQEAGAEEAPQEVEELVDVSAPGGEIVVLGKRERNLQRASTQAISVLSAEDIARTGEGDIAGALGRVTGLSVVRGGFVYVRGLGDRYSSALLNGLPLPSPEPLRRAVPLDLFPTDVIASSLVQKTYSPNFGAEFGGGVINLTTLAVPDAPFFNASAGISGDTETTGQLGYLYRGSSSDWTGFDGRARSNPPALRRFFASGERLSATSIDSGSIAREFVGGNNGLIQRNDRVEPNFSGSLSGGTSWDIGDNRLGLIATAGIGNKWRTRDNTQQTPATADLSQADRDYREVATENRVVTNALVGLGYEFGDHKLRWTNLFIHDTLKRASLSEGVQNQQRTGQDFREQGTAWYERELLNTQLNGSFRFDPIKLDLRASYAKSGRDAPYELFMGYARLNQPSIPFGNVFLNRLDNGQTGFARIAFSELDEELWSTGADVSMDVGSSTVLSAGIDFSDTQRDSSRREFQIIAPSSFPNAVAILRPDYLLGDAVIDTFDIGLIETTEADPAFAASLRTKAGYLQAQTELRDGLELSAGLRFERGEQNVVPRQVFNVLTNSGATAELSEDYLLPAATLTWKFKEDMQLRLNASRTIARPQFRELMFQAYFDPESNRAFRGNPLLVDSEFTNAEARYEWYFSREERFSIAGFWKSIDRPIEAFTGFNDNTPVTSFANAPKATLYGVETEVTKFFGLDRFAKVPFLASRQLVVIGNYTFTQSELEVTDTDTVNVFGTAVQPAANFFFDGAPLSGQSDHLVNLQFGLESSDKLSQQTLLIAYASDRVTSRGAAGLPDIYERPGLSVDLVMREGFEMFGRDMELKVEGRNLNRQNYREFQERGGNRIFYNRYDVGATFSVSVSTRF